MPSPYWTRSIAQIAALLVRSLDWRRACRAPRASGAAGLMVIALLFGISGYLLLRFSLDEICGSADGRLRRTAGTRTAAVTTAIVAMTAPTVKARVKSWLASLAAASPAPTALDKTATPAAPPSS